MGTTLAKEITVIALAAAVGVGTIELYSRYATNSTTATEPEVPGHIEKNLESKPFGPNVEGKRSEPALPRTAADPSENSALKARIEKLEKALEAEKLRLSNVPAATPEQPRKITPRPDSSSLPPSASGGSSPMAGRQSGPIPPAVSASQSDLSPPTRVKQELEALTQQVAAGPIAWPEPGVTLWKKAIAIYRLEKLSKEQNNTLLVMIDDVYRSASKATDPNTSTPPIKDKLLIIRELRSGKGIIGRPQLASLDTAESSLRKIDTDSSKQ